MGRTNSRASNIAAMQTTKMMPTVDNTSFLVNADTGANASAVSILATTAHRSPGMSAGA